MEATTTPVLSCTFHMGNSHSPGWRSLSSHWPVLRRAGREALRSGGVGQQRGMHSGLRVAKPPALPLPALILCPQTATGGRT